MVVCYLVWFGFWGVVLGVFWGKLSRLKALDVLLERYTETNLVRPFILDFSNWVLLRSFAFAALPFYLLWGHDADVVETPVVVAGLTPHPKPQENDHNGAAHPPLVPPNLVSLLLNPPNRRQG